LTADRTRPTSEAPTERAAWLRDELNRHLRLYHAEDAPEISDAAYDRLYRELEALEAAHPELREHPDTPTRRVGAPPAEGFTAFEHRVPMLSLDNAMSADELRVFDERVRRELERESAIAYAVEPKLDGAGIELVYENGALRVGATRGKRRGSRSIRGCRASRAQ
jgi:DNA ligase (NAD+)